MSIFSFVRHARASAFSAEDHDQLSEIGAEQARRLGAYWAERGVRFDEVYVGPRRRHRQTLALVVEEYLRRGRAWPEAVALTELDEHQGILLLFKLLPTLAAEDDVIRRLADGMARAEPPAPADVLAVFRQITQRWARGELRHPDVEPWPEFRARVRRGLERMAGGRGRTVAAFTSAGPVAAAVGTALEIGDEKVLDLSWALNNASVSELAFSPGRWGLRAFNSTAHILDPALVTAV